MPASLPSPQNCCTKCGNEIVTSVPGPRGPAGTNGTNGTNGVNGYAVTVTDFIMPAVNGTASVNIDNPIALALGQVAYLGQTPSGSVGYFQVVGITGSTILLFNLGYPINTTPGTNITAGQLVVAGGLRGPAGTSGVSTLNSISPTTAKGDLIVDNGVNNPAASDVKLSVGSDGKLLTADSSQATGLNWKALDLTGAGTALSGALPIANGGTGQTTRTTALNALAPASPAAGDLLQFDGTNWARLARGASLQVLQTNFGATAIGWANNVNSVLQMVSAKVIAKSTMTTVVPADDTIPDGASEGTNVMTLSVTPTSISSRLSVRVLLNASMGGNGSDTIISFLTVTGSTSAVCVSSINAQQFGMVPLELFYTFVPGTISTITLTVFLGPATGGSTITLNGSNGSRLFGGTLVSSIEAVEYA